VKKKDPLGQFEQLVLTAVLQLRENAYGLGIARRVSRLGGREVSTGSVYMTLERLQDKGYVRSWIATPTEEAGGHPRRYFCVLPAGERVLGDSLEISRQLAKAFDDVGKLGRWIPGKI
jgi:DNA-binding PadR family transcriptional regulator